MARLDDFRRKYPEYDDVPDQQLADALHAKYYSDVPLDQYYSQLGLASEPVDPVASEDDTTFLGALEEAGKRALGGVYTGGVDLVGGLGQLAPGIDDQSMVDMSTTARAETAEALGYDPAYSEDFITEDGFDANRFVAQLGGVIGNMAPQVLSLAIPGARERNLARFATFIGQSVSEGGFERPEDLTTFQRLADKGGDIGLALLEPLGLDRVVRGVPKGFFQSPEGNPFLRRIESMLRSGVAEGVQETAQGIARDLKALAIYDPDREIADSAVEDFTLGGGAGAFFDFAINAAMGGNRRTRKVEAPKEITEPTEDQIAEEERARAEKLEQEAARVATKDAELAAAREPSVAPDPISSVSIDPELGTEDIVAEIQRRQSVPAGAMFEVEGQDGMYIVSQNGRQFGPAMRDPVKAQEVKARLSEESDGLRVEAVIDAHIAETGGRGPDPDIRVLKSLAGKGLIEQSLVDDEIRRQKQNRKTRAIEEAGTKALARMTSEGTVSQEAFDGLMKGRMKRFYQSIRDSGRRFTPEEPIKPRLASRRATAEPAPAVNLMERRIDTALNRKGIGNRLNSKEGSGVVQTIVGRPVSESKPLTDLTRSEMDYVLQAIEQAPQITTPRGTGVDQVDPVTGVTVPSRPRMIGPEAAIFIPNFADVAKPAQPDVRTEPVEKGKELVMFDPEAESKAVDRQLESAVNKQVQDILKSVGIDGDYAAKIVDQVGIASRDSAGNVYVTPPEKPQTGEITTMGSAQAGAKVIQIALDGVKQRVDQGMSFEEATAMVMNHELVHALRAMDLFTAKEFSLLERLSRQYGKPGTNKTYAQWAVSTYATKKDPETGQEVPQDAVIQQEEAIAEMLSDAMTKGVLINGNVQKIGGKPQTLIKRIVNFFKRMVGYAQNNDIDSYKQLVSRIQTGEVGGRERDVVRTLMQTEKNLGEVQERAVTTEDLQLVTGTRPTKEQITAIAANLKEQVGQMVADNPELDPNIGKRAADTPDEVLESRVAEAANQRFRVNIPYYHGTATDPLVDGGKGIRRFQGKLGMGVVAGHFTENPKFASDFAPQLMTYQPEYPVVYPVFLRYGEDNEAGGLFEVRSAIQNEGNPVSQSINRTLNNQPELKSNLESYFASELEKGRELGPDKTKLRGFEQDDIARFYYEGAMSLREASERLAEDFHNRVAPQAYGMIVEDPYGVDFTQLEPLAPYMKEAGFVGYYDIERPGDPYSAVAMFNSEDIKGMFARFDPESVPEGRRYEDDIMYSRSSARSIDPVKIEKVVAQNQQEAERAGTTVPLYSVKASPEAQYIARNPEAAIVPDEILESRDPEYRPETKSFIGRLVTDRPDRVDPMQQYMDATGDNSPLSYKFTKARQAILNRYARLEKLNQKYFNDYLADSSSIAAVLFADRSAGVTAEAFKSGVPQYKDGLTKVVDFSHNGKQYRGLIDIIDLLRTKQYGDLTQFAQAYAIAMRGKRLNDDGKVTPVTDADYQQALRDVEQFTDANGNNPVKEWYGAWQAYNNQVITFLQDTGVLNEKTAEDWRLAADYIPYYRALDPKAEIGKVVTNAYGDLRKLGAFKAYKGKTDKINVPLIEAITKNVGSAIDLGMRNVAQQRIARDMQKLQLATQVPASRKDDAAVIGFKVRGEPVYFQIHDPLILESMSAIESSGLENLSRMYFGPFSSLLRETVTRTPGFMIANLLRDSLSAFVTSGARFLPWIDTTKGYFADVNRLERTGVVGGYDFNIDQKDLGKLFEEESANRKRRGLPLNMIRTMWRFAGRQTTRSDAATRQAVYNDVYSRTGNEAEAHYQAMEILNFSRRGSNGVMRAIATAVPFLNARIQGLDVLYRGAIGVNPANRELTQNRAIIGFAMRGALLGFATALYWAQVSDEDEYREASRELRDNNWLFPVPWLKDVGAIAIPIPFEVGLIFKTIPEVVLDTTSDKRTGKQAFESGKQAILSTLNFNPVPQALTPVLEAITNYDVYTGRTIVPIWMTGQRPEMQRTDATTELSLLLQKATIPFGGGGISPMKIDHIIRGYTGGTGVFVTSWIDRIVRDPTVSEGLDAIGYNVKQPEMSALATYDYPVVKRFLTSPEGSGLKEQFYDLYSEIRQDYNSMNALIRDGRHDELDALIPKIGNLSEVKDGVYSIKKDLDDIRVMRRAIMRSDLDAEMKKEQLDALREYENNILSVTPLLESLANRSVIRGL